MGGALRAARPARWWQEASFGHSLFRQGWRHATALERSSVREQRRSPPLVAALRRSSYLLLRPLRAAGSVAESANGRPSLHPLAALTPI